MIRSVGRNGKIPSSCFILFWGTWASQGQREVFNLGWCPTTWDSWWFGLWRVGVLWLWPWGCSHIHTGPAHLCTHGECGACKVAAGPFVPTFLPSPHVPILPLAQVCVLFPHILFSVGLSPMWLGDIWQPWWWNSRRQTAWEEEKAGPK